MVNRRTPTDKAHGGRQRLVAIIALLAALATALGSVGVAVATGATADGAVPPSAGALVIAGDRIAAIVPAAPDAPALYAVGSRHLYRTGDGGKTWQIAGPVPPPGQIVAGVDDAQVLLAGNQELCARGGGGTPLSRSDDGGATWTHVPNVANVRPLAIWHAAGLALGSSCASLQVSTDAGRTWHAASASANLYDVTAFAALPAADPAKPAALIAGTSEGGLSRLWRLDLSDRANPRLDGPLKEFWGIGALAGSGQTYLIGAADGVWLSDDAGHTWTQHRQGLEDVTISVNPLQAPIPTPELQRGFGISTVVLDPANADHLFAGTVDGVYSSHDAGISWQRVAGVTGKVIALDFVLGSSRVYAQTPVGVWVTRDIG